MTLRGVGSSPRAWGILKETVDGIGEERFIPTGVGNTFTTKKTTAVFSVHPHGRGEYANNS